MPTFVNYYVVIMVDAVNGKNVQNLNVYSDFIKNITVMHNIQVDISF